ncbi:hypothetical protein [Streptomyces sp. enrichment culture]|uniref:hypothetical protein n=1 Tax=Streptomyces sp. enrichment culture TaxID=1795815 RepID=UPI003F566CC9
MTGPLCGAAHHLHPDTLCTQAAGHYRRDRDPHGGPLIIDGRECGGAAWDEPQEQQMTDRYTVDTITSDQLDALYAEQDRLTAELGDYEQRAENFERRHATLKRAHIALAEQAGRDQASLARVRALGDRIEEFAKTALKTDDRELYAAIASDIRSKIDGASEASGYCPACGRGDCAPTPDEYEQQRQRADRADEATRRALDQRQEMAQERFAWQERGDRAEAALVRVHHLAAVIHAGAPWTANHTELATRIRAAITGPNTTEK